MSSAGADHDVVRDPGPARDQAVEHLRADPPDGSQPRPDLAPGDQQALRGAEEARRRRLAGRPASWSAGGPGPCTRSPRRAGARWPTGCTSRATVRCWSSSSCSRSGSPTTATRTTRSPASPRRAPGRRAQRGEPGGRARQYLAGEGPFQHRALRPCSPARSSPTSTAGRAWAEWATGLVGDVAGRPGRCQAGSRRRWRRSPTGADW